MSENRQAVDPEARFELRLPDGWSAEADDEEGGIELWAEDGPGSLHLVSFDHDGLADAAEELYAFLEERGVELEDDDVDDVALAGGAEMALAEYEAEDEDDGEVTFWLVGVATAPGTLVFATYLAPGGEAEEEIGIVREALASLRLRAGEHGAGPP
jgi:hypothetical protein